MSAIVLVLFLSPRVTGAQEIAEYQVKAAFVYNFLKLTEFQHTIGGEKFNLCLLGEPGDLAPFDSLTGKELGAARIEVILNPKSIDTDCAAVFVHAKHTESVKNRLVILSLAGILTIGEHESFMGSGGIIRLFQDSTRVRFEINKKLAERGGLVLSSKLLSLAVLFDSEVP